MLASQSEVLAHDFVPLTWGVFGYQAPLTHAVAALDSF